ncbi:MAG: DUF6078 family protein [Parabacteroides sp.]|nr:DUF6078 family protein [Parabacteroides sp.]
MEEKPFDYSEIPFLFGMCAESQCPQSETCLRQFALRNIPADVTFVSTLNPAWIKERKGKCRYYCSNEKVRYAKGFICTVKALTLRVEEAFRMRLILYFGRKNYYLKRRGALLLSPEEQTYIIALAKKMGVEQDEYFDGYVEQYRWE